MQDENDPANDENDFEKAISMQLEIEDALVTLKERIRAHSLVKVPHEELVVRGVHPRVNQALTAFEKVLESHSLISNTGSDLELML